MNFHPFSVVKTREALRADVISQREELQYWLFSSVIWLFYMYHSGWVGLAVNWFLLYDVVAALAILVIGLHEAFKANGGESGRDFLRRVILVSVPLGVCVLLASQALFWLGWWVFPRVFTTQSFRDPALAWQVVNFLIFNGIQIWFWWRTSHHLSILNSQHHE